MWTKTTFVKFLKKSSWPSYVFAAILEIRKKHKLDQGKFLKNEIFFNFKLKNYAKFHYFNANFIFILIDKKPLEIRIQTEKLGRGVSWRNKAMKWYFQSVFSGAPQILVGIRPRRENYVESFKKFSIEKMRMEAEWEGNMWWSRKQCLGFVDQMLKYDFVILLCNFYANFGAIKIDFWLYFVMKINFLNQSRSILKLDHCQNGPLGPFWHTKVKNFFLILYFSEESNMS